MVDVEKWSAELSYKVGASRTRKLRSFAAEVLKDAAKELDKRGPAAQCEFEAETGNFYTASETIERLASSYSGSKEG